MTDGEYWVCPKCGYEWSDPKDEWIKSESCELCDNCYIDRYSDCIWETFYESKFKLPNHPPWYHKEKTYE
jgi:hypothetical protein